MPESRTQDGAIKAPPTRRETLGNMLRSLQIDPDARGVGVAGRVGAGEWRIRKTLGQPISAEITMPVGQGTVRMGRDESGRFIGVNQRVRGVDIDAGYDAQRGSYVSGKKSVGWGNK